MLESKDNLSGLCPGRSVAAGYPSTKPGGALSGIPVLGQASDNGLSRSDLPRPLKLRTLTIFPAIWGYNRPPGGKFCPVRRPTKEIFLGEQGKLTERRKGKIRRSATGLAPPRTGPTAPRATLPFAGPSRGRLYGDFRPLRWWSADATPG